jgi:hypothetical protein
MFLAKRGQDMRRNRYGRIITVADALSSLPVVVLYFIVVDLGCLHQVSLVFWSVKNARSNNHEQLIQKVAPPNNTVYKMGL